MKIYPGKDCVFALYEDENDNYNYERGDFSIITFVWNQKAQKLTIKKREGSFKGMLQKRTFFIEKVGTKEKTAVEYNGQEISINI